MTPWTLKTNPFARILKKDTVITVDDHGIDVVQGDSSHHFQWDQIDKAPKLSLSVSGGCLTLVAQGISYSYRMLSHLAPFQYATKLFPLWANQNAENLQSFLQHAYSECTKKFIRDSSVNRIQTFACQEIKQWKGWNTIDGLSELAIKTATQLNNIHNWTPADIEKIRQSYLQKQLI